MWWLGTIFFFCFFPLPSCFFFLFFLLTPFLSLLFVRPFPPCSLTPRFFLYFWIFFESTLSISPSTFFKRIFPCVKVHFSVFFKSSPLQYPYSPPPPPYTFFFLHLYFLFFPLNPNKSFWRVFLLPFCGPAEACSPYPLPQFTPHFFLLILSPFSSPVNPPPGIALCTVTKPSTPSHNLKTPLFPWILFFLFQAPPPFLSLLPIHFLSV